MSEQKYTIPDNLWDVKSRVVALQQLQDSYIALRFFGYRLAKKAAIEASREMSAFWDGVVELYPELKGKRLTTTDGKEVVVMKLEEVEGK